MQIFCKQQGLESVLKIHGIILMLKLMVQSLF
uniref:Uncharacterized protein n=1 Tax=Anguilla anguilla TaxID=7936 RepID=A0A0E9UM19_ANGAN